MESLFLVLTLFAQAFMALGAWMIDSLVPLLLVLLVVFIVFYFLMPRQTQSVMARMREWRSRRSTSATATSTAQETASSTTPAAATPPAASATTSAPATPTPTAVVPEPQASMMFSTDVFDTWEKQPELAKYPLVKKEQYDKVVMDLAKFMRLIVDLVDLPPEQAREISPWKAYDLLSQFASYEKIQFGVIKPLLPMLEEQLTTAHPLRDNTAATRLHHAMPFVINGLAKAKHDREILKDLNHHIDQKLANAKDMVEVKTAAANVFKDTSLEVIAATKEINQASANLKETVRANSTAGKLIAAEAKHEAHDNVVSLEKARAEVSTAQANQKTEEAKARTAEANKATEEAKARTTEARNNARTEGNRDGNRNRDNRDRDNRDRDNRNRDNRDRDNRDRDNRGQGGGNDSNGDNAEQKNGTDK